MTLAIKFIEGVLIPHKLPNYIMYCNLFITLKTSLLEVLLMFI